MLSGIHLGDQVGRGKGDAGAQVHIDSSFRGTGVKGFDDDQAVGSFRAIGGCHGRVPDNGGFGDVHDIDTQ